MTPRFNRNAPFTVCRLPARVMSAPLCAVSSCSRSSWVTGVCAGWAASAATTTSRPIGPTTIARKVFVIDTESRCRYRDGLRWVRNALGLQQFPTQGNSVRDVIVRGTFAHMHGQHSSKRAGARLEYLHGAPPQMAVFGHEQHHASHQGGTADQRAMTFLIATEGPARQAIAQKRGLPKSEAKTFAGDGVHSARGVAYQYCASTIHASQSSGDGDCAPFAGSVFRIFEACTKFRKFPERILRPQPQLRARRDHRHTNFFAADGGDVNLAATDPVQFHEGGPGSDAATRSADFCSGVRPARVAPALPSRGRGNWFRRRPQPSARAPILQQPTRLPDEAR